MANKDALRELQTRLAERLQAVRSGPAIQSWLAVDCAGQGFLFPLRLAGEIFDSQRIVAVPHTQPWVVGVANLRGGLHLVADLGAFLGLRAAHRGALVEHERLVGFNPNLALNCALLVDGLEGLRRAGELQREAGDEEERPGFAGPRWIDQAGRVWQEIDLAELAAHPRFLGIAG